MHGYNMIEVQIYYPRYIYMIEGNYGSIAIASVTGANYCPDTYLIMLVVRHLFTIMFTQRSSCIGRLQVEKRVTLFFQA